MSLTIEEIAKESEKLSEKERAELAKRLISSLDPGERDENYDELWRQEIERRGEELANGTAKTVAWEDIKKRYE